MARHPIKAREDLKDLVLMSRHLNKQGRVDRRIRSLVLRRQAALMLPEVTHNTTPLRLQATTITNRHSIRGTARRHMACSTPLSVDSTRALNSVKE